MSVIDESFRQISQNCDYFCIFKNPRNSSEIRTLAQQMTPGNMILVQIYMEATKGPFSYLFINLTQECDPNVKFISDIFNDLCIYIPDGKTFKQIRTVGEYQNIKLIYPGFNKTDKTSDGIIFHDMSKNTGQTTKINTHLVNFGQPSNILMDKTEHDNIVPKVETVSTQPKQYAEVGTNTNIANN